MLNSPIFWSIIIILASLSGLFFSIKLFQNWIEKNMPYLLSLSAGVFLITAFQLIKEGFHIDSGALTTSGAMAGFIIILIIQKLLPESHHHHSTKEEAHSSSSATKILIADTVHNIGDGIVVAMAFAINIHIGILTAISILIHEIIQEISEYFVYRSSGYSLKKTIILNTLSASAILIGTVIGITVGESNTLQGILLGIAAGIFLQVVFVDLMPSRDDLDKPMIWKHIFAFLFGAGIILGIGLLVPHEHDHGVPTKHMAQIAENSNLSILGEKKMALR